MPKRVLIYGPRASDACHDFLSENFDESNDLVFMENEPRFEFLDERACGKPKSRLTDIVNGKAFFINSSHKHRGDSVTFIDINPTEIIKPVDLVIWTDESNCALKLERGSNFIKFRLQTNERKIVFKNPPYRARQIGFLLNEKEFKPKTYPEGDFLVLGEHQVNTIQSILALFRYKIHFAFEQLGPNEYMHYDNTGYPQSKQSFKDPSKMLGQIEVQISNEKYDPNCEYVQLVFSRDKIIEGPRYIVKPRNDSSFELFDKELNTFWTFYQPYITPISFWFTQNSGSAFL